MPHAMHAPLPYMPHATHVLAMHPRTMHAPPPPHTPATHATLPSIPPATNTPCHACPLPCIPPTTYAPPLWTDRHLWKHNLRKLHLRAVKTWLLWTPHLVTKETCVCFRLGRVADPRGWVEVVDGRRGRHPHPGWPIRGLQHPVSLHNYSR